MNTRVPLPELPRSETLPHDVCAFLTACATAFPSVVVFGKELCYADDRARDSGGLTIPLEDFERLHHSDGNEPTAKNDAAWRKTSFGTAVEARDAWRARKKSVFLAASPPSTIFGRTDLYKTVRHLPRDHSAYTSALEQYRNGSLPWHSIGIVVEERVMSIFDPNYEPRPQEDKRKRRLGDFQWSGIARHLYKEILKSRGTIQAIRITGPVAGNEDGTCRAQVAAFLVQELDSTISPMAMYDWEQLDRSD